VDVRQVSPAVTATSVEFLAEGDRGLELGGGTNRNGIRVRQIGEPANLSGEGGLLRKPRQQAFAGSERDA
jgi:hypothetical protein